MNNSKKVSKSFLDEVKLDELKNGITVASAERKYDTSYDVNVEISRFNTGDTFTFVDDVIREQPIRVNGRTQIDPETGKARAAVFVYVVCNNRPKKFFLRSINKAVNSVKRPDVAGTPLIQDRMYVANRRDFDVAGEKSDFAKVVSMFPSEGYAMEALAKLEVECVCEERKQVLTARYDRDANGPSLTKTQNNSVMYIEFAATGKDRDDLIEQLSKEAEEAMSRQAKRLEEAVNA